MDNFFPKYIDFEFVGRSEIAFSENQKQIEVASARYEYIAGSDKNLYIVPSSMC